MEKMIAFCGNICTECPAFIITNKNDDSERKKIAELWQKLYNPNINPEDINCDGCLSENGRLFNYCRTCEIRKCGMEKGLKNCAYCDDYICEKLSKFYDLEPKGKQVLDKIRGLD